MVLDVGVNPDNVILENSAANGSRSYRNRKSPSQDGRTTTHLRRRIQPVQRIVSISLRRTQIRDRLRPDVAIVISVQGQR